MKKRFGTQQKVKEVEEILNQLHLGDRDTYIGGSVLAVTINCEEIEHDLIHVCYESGEPSEGGLRYNEAEDIANFIVNLKTLIPIPSIPIKDQTLAKLIVKEADRIIYVSNEKSIPLIDLPLKVAVASLKENGYYGYTMGDKKFLLLPETQRKYSLDDAKEIYKKAGYVSNHFHLADIRQRFNDEEIEFSEDDVLEVAERLEALDCNIGICWDVIDGVISDVSSGR